MGQTSDTEMMPVPASVQMPKFLRCMIEDAAAKSARNFTGEVVWRLASSFGVYPDGSAREEPRA